ncbi:uncharacterized protein LOC133725955 [Rosa rugosa]|uniref:Triacylglycerol lipase n=1 Tax=Rosa chinensis TaxID=74649 RepID=A0A2P6S1W7_ROSCH|nr:uncharacterized protein LOC112188766 [Rosa chinensis]XP_062009362.1 uncharacterized protein LOC133725955 [Rosa rugosa]PRQ52661.1 hypothetical protein RchiOBHm_Chr2g0157891 [Rosa chinensis]
MNRLRGSGKLFSQSLPQLRTNMRHRALRSWTAVQDTFFSTKDVFESHKVVFTVGTSIASVATAWIGYTVRHLHDTRVDRRLESIEKTIKENHHIKESEIREVIGSGSISLSSCIATAGTTLIIGYALGWRGGRWFANKQFRKEQMKLLGHVKPKRWQLLRQRIQQPKGWQFQFLKRPLLKHKTPENAVKTCEKIKDTQTAHNLENPVNLVSKQMS